MMDTFLPTVSGVHEIGSTPPAMRVAFDVVKRRDTRAPRGYQPGIASDAAEWRCSSPCRKAGTRVGKLPGAGSGMSEVRVQVQILRCGCDGRGTGRCFGSYTFVGRLPHAENVGRQGVSGPLCNTTALKRRDVGEGRRQGRIGTANSCDLPIGTAALARACHAPGCLLAFPAALNRTPFEAVIDYIV